MMQTEISRAKTLRTSADLLEAGMIAPDQVSTVDRIGDNFSIAVSPEIADRIVEAGVDSAVGRQFLPDAKEFNILPEEKFDPIGDLPYMPVKGITHRYPDRLLLIANHNCAVYCRFCFRREKVGVGQEFLNPAELAAALDYIRQRPAVREVIITGGDPLVLSLRRIKHLMDELSAMPHVEIIRFHTRIPVVAPHLITPELVALLEACEKIVCVVVHTNHASEFGDAARRSLRMLRKAGLMLVGHSVLLKGVNNSVEALTDLFRECLRNGVKPYYLHHCDLAEGTSHFRTTFDEGQELMRNLRGTVSGLAQPSYVLHIPDGSGKVPIGPNYLERSSEATWDVTNYKGGHYEYVVPAAS